VEERTCRCALNVQSLVSGLLSVSPGDAGCSPVVLELHQHPLNIAASTSCSELKERPEQVLDRASIVSGGARVFAARANVFVAAPPHNQICD